MKLKTVRSKRRVDSKDSLSSVEAKIIRRRRDAPEVRGVETLARRKTGIPR
jgi:hypothetical protein